MQRFEKGEWRMAVNAAVCTACEMVFYIEEPSYIESDSSTLPPKPWWNFCPNCGADMQAPCKSCDRYDANYFGTIEECRQTCEVIKETQNETQEDNKVFRFDNWRKDSRHK